MIATAPATTTASWADVPFGEFLQLLRRNGFAVGLQHYARMMTLLDTLGPDTSPIRVRSVLAPVFATTPDQQERFYKLFDQWFPVLVASPPDGVRAALNGDGTDGPIPDPQSRRGRVKPKPRYLPALVAFAVMALIATVVWLATRPESVPVPVDLPTPVAPQPTQPVPAPVSTAPPAVVEEGPAPERQVDWLAIRAGTALLILVGFVANEWRLYRRRLMVLERQRRERPPLVWPIRIEAGSTPLVESSEFLTAARRLRERQTGDRERLDIEASIAATIRALGRPVMHYVKETRPPDYLILIERASARDHQAKLYLHLIEHLVAEGVHATVYWCEEDPRICDPVIDGPTATLVELRHKFPSYRLLLFGSGDGLIDPISGRRKAWVSDTLSWPDRALLTPEPPESWGAREVALAGHLMVLPGTLGGLQAAIDHFQIPAHSEFARRRHRGSYVPEPDATEGVRAIKSYLGPKGLQWVCACAVYPDLQWNLTLHLGMMPELGGTIDDALLAKLVRLSWFRQGTIPDESRAVLLRVIEPEVERAARRAIITLLERNPAPPESIASSRFELDLVVQKFALDSRTRSRRRELAKVARQAPREHVLSELAVLRLTEGDPGSPVAMRLPERLRDVFFQGGVSVLGLTSGARSLVAMAIVAFVLMAGPGQGLPPEDLAAEQPADSGQQAAGDGLTPSAESPARTTQPADTTSTLAAQPTTDSTATPSPTPSASRELSATERLLRGESAVRSRQYAAADSIGEELRRGQALAGADQKRLVVLIAASAFPPTGSQNRERALGAIRALLDGDPSFRFPADMSWPGLDQLLEEERSVRAAAARASTVAVVRIGSRSPNATLYIRGVQENPIDAVRSIPVTAGEATRLSIRSAGCETGWDTTVVVAAGDTAVLGLRDAPCSAVAVSPPAAAAPDPAIVDQLIADATSIARATLAGPWRTLSKAPLVTYGSDQQRQRLTGAFREGSLAGTLNAVERRSAGGPAVTADSVFLTADMRFTWRSFAGANQANDATIEMVFERTSTRPQLRRMHIVLKAVR